MVNGVDRVIEQSGQGDEVTVLRQQVTRLTQACLAADALISSLLAIREGATDELLIEVRDFLREAVAYREQKEG